MFTKDFYYNEIKTFGFKTFTFVLCIQHANILFASESSEVLLVDRKEAVKCITMTTLIR